MDTDTFVTYKKADYGLRRIDYSGCFRGIKPLQSHEEIKGSYKSIRLSRNRPPIKLYEFKTAEKSDDHNIDAQQYIT